MQNIKLTNKLRTMHDNSYAICLSDPRVICDLAGTNNKEPVKVNIKSLPFYVPILNKYTDDKRLTLYEFVIVEYDDLEYMYLNLYH